MKHAVQNPTRERRTLARVGCAFPVIVETAAQYRNTATMSDVGRGGIRLHLARALMPGQFAILRCPLVRPDRRIEFKVRVVWCRYVVAQAQFEAGARILHDVLDVALQLSDLVYDALDQAGSTEPLFDENWAMPMAWSA